ncbi:DoxX family protein [Mucilaginibacter sp. AW1-3]
MSTEKKVTKTTRIIYWVTTVLIALPQLGGAFMINSDMSKQMSAHLGLPYWLMVEASIGNTIGALILIIPMWKWLKDWAYVAFGITFISALIAHIVVDGFGSEAIQAIIFFAVLFTSYIYYHKIND